MLAVLLLLFQYSCLRDFLLHKMVREWRKKGIKFMSGNKLCRVRETSLAYQEKLGIKVKKVTEFNVFKLQPWERKTLLPFVPVMLIREPCQLAKLVIFITQHRTFPDT